MSPYPNSIPRCQHLKINGTQCGSPALKRNHLCYFHKRWQETRIVLNANRARRGRAALDLPVLEDANSIQVSLMQVMRLILSGQMDTKTAGLLLYALQTASSNLRRTDFEPSTPNRVVIDPKTVDQTPLGEHPWRPEDFEEDEYEEAGEPVAPKPVDVGIDPEWQVHIPGINAQAEAEEKSEQTIPQIQAVAASPCHRPASRKSHSNIRRSAKGFRGVRGRIRGGRFRRGGTTSIVPVSLPRPIPLFSESTYGGKS